MRIAVVLLALLAVPFLGQSDALAAVGARRIEASAPHRGAPLGVTVFYPAAAGGKLTELGRNAVFEGVRVQMNAPVAEGRFPVLLLSHGGLRSASESAAWISARLAAAGYVVAYPTAPKLAGKQASTAGGEVLHRADDISAALTALEADPHFKAKLAEGRVGVLGFQLGATAALEVAGAQLDGARYAASCDSGGTGVDCAWFKHHGVDLHHVDTAAVERSRLDKRIKAVVAVDPEYGRAFKVESLKAVTMPVALIALGAPGKASAGFGELAHALPHAEQMTLAEGTRFDAFDICRPRASLILKEEGESDGICASHAPARRAVHQKLQQDVVAFFHRALAAQQQAEQQ